VLTAEDFALPAFLILDIPRSVLWLSQNSNRLLFREFVGLLKKQVRNEQAEGRT